MRPVTPWLLIAVACSSCVGMLSPSSDPKPVQRGPIAMRSTGPIVQTYLGFRPRLARTQPSQADEITVATQYGNIFEVGSSDTSEVRFDGEMWRTSLGWRRSIGEHTDVSIEIPVLYATSGFLDVFIESWHSLFLLPDSGREDKPRFDYEMDATHNGTEIYRLSGNEVGLCDVPIVVTHALLDEEDDGWALALTAGVELPTGSEEDGFGNGGIDWGGGVLADKSVDRFTFTGGLQRVITAQSSKFSTAGIDALDAWNLAAGVECLWSDSSSLLFGLRFVSPATSDFGIEEIDGDSLEIDFGMAFDLTETTHLTVGLTEDVLSNSTPDFTVFAALVLAL